MNPKLRDIVVAETVSTFLLVSSPLQYISLPTFQTIKISNSTRSDINFQASKVDIIRSDHS
jgi:hypothetical protein